MKQLGVRKIKLFFWQQLLRTQVKILHTRPDFIMEISFNAFGEKRHYPVFLNVEQRGAGGYGWLVIFVQKFRNGEF